MFFSPERLSWKHRLPQIVPLRCGRNDFNEDVLVGKLAMHHERGLQRTEVGTHKGRKTAHSADTGHRGQRCVLSFSSYEPSFLCAAIPFCNLKNGSLLPNRAPWWPIMKITEANKATDEARRPILHDKNLFCSVRHRNTSDTFWIALAYVYSRCQLSNSVLLDVAIGSSGVFERSTPTQVFYTVGCCVTWQVSAHLAV